MYSGRVKNQLATKPGADLSAHTQEKPFLVLADCSGSMHQITASGQSRFRELQAALGSALASRNDYRLAGFSDGHALAKNARGLVHEGGGTRLAKALEELASPFVERVLIATDGEPTDYPTERVLDVLKTRFEWVRVDVLFIGEKGGNGEYLMKQVARNCGTLYTTSGNLLGGITLLLEGAQ